MTTMTSVSRLGTALAGAFSLALISSGCKPATPANQAGGGGGMSFQVVAIEVKKQPVAEIVPLVGTLAANEFVEIKAEADGVVQRIAFDEGQRVEAGALLVALDESKFTASLHEAEAALELSKANFERAKQLLTDKLIAQQDYDQTAASYNVNRSAVELRSRLLKDAQIFAPFAGRTGARQISPGQVIARSTVLTTLVDLDTMKAELNVPERFLGQVAAGQKIEFRVDAFPEDRFTGEVYFVSPQLDPGTRTALVKARVSNADGRLRAGMFAKLDLSVKLRDSALVIPEPAIISSGDTNMVFVVTPQNTAAMKPVKLGLRLAGKAEVLSGLEAGEKVVVEGVKKIFPGAPVKPGPQESAAPYQN
jgi:membrane fusion protein (multidrug efflux system)